MNPSTHILSLLIHSENAMALCFLSMLDSKDIIELMLLNSEIYQRVAQSPALMNKLFYNKRLQIEKSMYFDFQIDGIDSEQHLKEIIDRITTDTLNFAIQIQTLKSLEDQLKNNLELMIEPAEAQDHLDNLTLFMVEPELPMPELQKQNVGQYCHTPVQMFLINQNLAEKIQHFYQDPCPLRMKIVNQSQSILNYFNQEKNHNQLKQLRYNPQLMSQYIDYGVPFFNVIQILVLILKVHANSVKKLLECCEEAWASHKIFTEFTLRYMIYRNTVCALQDKYGFLFKHFNEAFAYQFKQYPSIPKFSLWRIALKIWVKSMEDFHSKNQETFSQLILIEMQSLTEATVTEYISNPQSPNNSSTQCEFRKSDSVSNEQYIDIIPQQRQSLLINYQQYLVDISANQFNIHWCGSTAQKLSGAYSNMQQQLLSSLNKYWSYIQNTFSSPVITKKIISDITDYLSQKLKPCTFIKIESQMNDCLEGFKKKVMQSDNQVFKQITNSWKQIKSNTVKTDKLISYLAQQRGLSQDSGQKYKMYFNTNESVDLNQLEMEIQTFKGQREATKEMITLQT